MGNYVFAEIRWNKIFVGSPPWVACYALIMILVANDDSWVSPRFLIYVFLWLSSLAFTIIVESHVEKVPILTQSFFLLLLSTQSLFLPLHF